MDLMVNQMVVAFNPFSAVWEFIKDVLGIILDYIFMFLEMIGIGDLALCIIVFTVVVYTLMLPFTIKQQKFTKLSAVMNPEIQAVTAKYKNKNDQESMMKQNDELKLIYQKYGTSPTGGCLTSFLSLPVLFAVYRVIYNLKAYAPHISNSHFFGYTGMNIEKDNPLSFIKANTSAFGEGDIKRILVIIAVVIIPLLSGLFQYLSTKLSNVNRDQSANDNPMMSSMNTMLVIMPLFSIWIGYSLPVAVGIYWTVSSLYRVVSQIVINKYLENVSVEDMIQKNIDKINKKREKDGLPPQKISATATANVRNIEPAKRDTEKIQKQVKESTEYYKNNATLDPNSLAAKASMVAQYNEKQKKRK